MRILLPLKRQGLYYPQSRPKEMTVMTLGRKAFEAFWLDRAGRGERSARTISQQWESTAETIRQAWEAAAKMAVHTYAEMLAAREAEWLKDYADRSAKQPTLYERCVARTHREGQRPRQGGMVNVHTKPPAHYNAHPSGVECIEVTRHLPFNLGNVVKYIWRSGLKENESEIKDLEKSLDYLNDEINKRKLALGITPSPLQELERLAAKVNGYGPDGKGHQ